jgi:TatD DNase family protein
MYPEQGQHINIHAHRRAAAGEWVLQNLRARSYLPDIADPDSAFSVGLHPWDLEKTDMDQALEKVQEATGNPQVMAIGEAGLDAMIPTPMDVQEQAFAAQLKIAEAADLPVIIHAVKSFQELIGFVKTQAPAVPMIIHGFRGGAQLAGDLLKFGFMLSFGESLLRSKKATAAFREVPDGKFFLETDESEVPISDIYKQAAQLRSVSVQDLKMEQLQAFTKFFKRK